jgi:DNA-binding FadR family transcriptional regulator
MIDSRKMSDQIVDLIIGKITDGTFKKGGKIPNEFELALELGVGRGSVREAEKILMSRNILVIRRGYGTFVADHPGQVEDPLGFKFASDKKKLLDDVNELCQFLLPEIAALAAERANNMEKKDLEDSVDKIKVAIQERRDHNNEDLAFFQKIAVCAHNEAMTDIVQVFGASFLPILEETGKHYGAEDSDSYEKILGAIIDENTHAAYSAMREYLSEAFHERSKKKKSTAGRKRKAGDEKG